MWIRHALGISAFTALLLSFSSTTLAEPVKHALLIGVSNYEDSKLSSLPGAKNDIQAMRQVLHEQFGFRPQNIKLLLDENATHTLVIEALKRLSSRVQKEDLVYIHYSGYGSNTPDLNGDERNGLDQTWVTFGSRSGLTETLDNFDLLDDEIDHWLAPAYAKAAQVVIVNDSARTGTLNRGDTGPLQRAAPNDSRLHPLGIQAFDRPDKSGAILVGSADSKSSAYEFLLSENSYGLFTWHWLKSLSNADPKDSWKQIFNRTYSQMKIRYSATQTPTFSGDTSSNVFGGEVSHRPSKFRVSSVEGKRVLVNKGVLHGLTQGSVFTLDSKAGDQGLIEIIETDIFSAKGLVKQGKFKPGDKLVQESLNIPRTTLKVFVSGDQSTPSDNDVIISIREVVTGTPGVALTVSQQQADLVLFYTRIDESLGLDIRPQSSAANLVLSLPEFTEDGSPRLLLLNADETPMVNYLPLAFQDGKKINRQQIEDRLIQIRDRKIILQLTSSSESISPVDLSVTHFRSQPSCKPIIQESCQEFAFGNFIVGEDKVISDLDKKQYKVGDILTFGLYNRTEQPQYVYLLNISPSGEIKMIYPTPDMGADASRIGGNKRIKQLPVAFQLDQYGVESIKVVASSRPVDPDFFSSISNPNARSGMSPDNTLERLLFYDMNRHTEIENQLLALEGMSWGTNSLSISVAANINNTKVSLRGAVGSSPEKAYVRVRVFFGSNRNYVPSKDAPGDRFGNDRGTLRLGSLWVSIPPNHKPGKLESPSLLSLMGENPDQHVMLQAVELLDQQTFVRDLKRAATEVKDQRMLLYVHGYNNSFEESARRAAQIAFDLSVEDVHYVPLLFTWPSGDSIAPTQYTRAWTNKEWAVSDLVEFLDIAVVQTGIDNVHVLAHSMGTNLFSSASLIMAGPENDSDRLFREVVLAAPDIDTETFYRLLLPRLEKVTDRITVYMASQDVALHVSKAVHSGYRRLGDSSGSPLIFRGIDVVDVSELNTSDMGHAYYAAIRELISDIGSTLKGVAPESRQLEGQVTLGEIPYWSFSKKPSSN